jgi:hypothetical protein
MKLKPNQIVYWLSTAMQPGLRLVDRSSFLSSAAEEPTPGRLARRKGRPVGGTRVSKCVGEGPPNVFCPWSRHNALADARASDAQRPIYRFGNRSQVWRAGIATLGKPAALLNPRALNNNNLAVWLDIAKRFNCSPRPLYVKRVHNDIRAQPERRDSLAL